MTEMPSQLRNIEAHIRRRLRAQFVGRHKRRRFLYRKVDILSPLKLGSFLLECAGRDPHIQKGSPRIYSWEDVNCMEAIIMRSRVRTRTHGSVSGRP